MLYLFARSELALELVFILFPVVLVLAFLRGVVYPRIVPLTMVLFFIPVISDAHKFGSLTVVVFIYFMSLPMTFLLLYVAFHGSKRDT